MTPRRIFDSGVQSWINHMNTTIVINNMSTTTFHFMELASYSGTTQVEHLNNSTGVTC